MRWWIVGMALAGCSEGTQGTDTPSRVDTGTPTGEPADEPTGGGVGGAGVVWVDANGEVVEGAAEVGGRLRYLDEDRWWWPLDPWGSGAEAFVPSGLGDALALWGEDVAELYFTDDACTEPAIYAPDAVVGVAVILLDGSFIDSPVPAGFDRTIWVATGTEAERTLDPVWYSEGCVQAPGGVPVLSGAGLERIEPPQTWWTPPLRPEIR